MLGVRFIIIICNVNNSLNIVSDAGIQSTTSQECTCTYGQKSIFTEKNDQKLYFRNDQKLDTSALQAGKSCFLEINNRNSGFGQLKKLLEKKINQ